ncbi:family 16 glycoside hydrolase [Planctomyces sp. SH-PL62]|uniref:family 16 glycoside hydrolase n=1 Tax=Planctomyces sp. SH-PL62 TaxID=1636152 RepID=UPI00078B2CAE|nr:family 16 glycoside hydrolase [Planctomyces sp. SH-PL62]AMV39302.1 Prenyltransferase and squalene oxidase repeat protein [Planctomyces sp. SH-PL62]
MRRLIGLFAVCLVALPSPPSSRGQTPADFAQTAAYVASLQNPDGGFGPSPGQPSSLGSTNSAARILRYVGGSIPDVLGCIRYVKSCRADGGFAPTPGGKPDSLSTSLGLLAVGELKIADRELIDGAVAYFHEHAKESEQVRMAIAGLEAVEAKSPDMAAWVEQIEKIGNPDGTIDGGPEQAFKAGTVAATVLRTGGSLKNREALIAAMKSGQRDDGGWSKDAGPSDLGSSYRIMRALYMLKEKPDLDRLRGFIAHCRKADGTYSATPDGQGSLSATYMASILTYWSRLLDGEPPVVETAGYVSLFNGRDLDGWEGDETVWSARDGMIVGKSAGLDHNVFLAYKQPFRDFVLSLSFRVIDGKGNSGVQLRSVRVPGTEMSGYQADIGDGYWGSLYDESRRNRTLVKGSPEALAKLNKAGWNHYVVRAFGDRITIYLNGAVAVDYKETDPAIARDGLLALQVHSGDPMEVQFKDVMIQRAPSPDAADPKTPGFHVRSVATEQGDYKYTIYVPEGYDGSRTYPAILFLHGAGERGDDGTLVAQVGLGPAIVQRGDIPAIVVFPQARKTWQAGSDDAKAALKALDEVVKEYRVDPDRIVLTGLSMGGMGTWSLAAQDPEKFAALVPICGPGRVEDVERYLKVPIRGFVGDADSPRLHLGMRTLIEALRAAGARPDYTEYRGVGHNSWDRAYNDPATIDWMLAQKRP